MLLRGLILLLRAPDEHVDDGDLALLGGCVEGRVHERLVLGRDLRGNREPGEARMMRGGQAC